MVAGEQHIEGFAVPVHRALTEAILLGGAPRAVAILNGTVAAAIGLGLQQWIAGLVLWIASHTLAVFATRRDPDFASVLVRHLRLNGWLAC
ncbi:VirB3 family type IV secretion system protein [Mesorhizobium delmotii]|uniref:Putative TRBD conjugal transfer protein n=1 Tax=Mesorhizobium delmotii TaxID=1631247 RepID=A0A2P9ALK7_9HYPH|nr:VirB3 family type IV secretion system protein [Mesorhizobium delmotii]SJM32035.1 putative TRBD conjugal transfer protein [Mesorhizobium delmotii]